MGADVSPCRRGRSATRARRGASLGCGRLSTDRRQDGRPSRPVEPARSADLERSSAGYICATSSYFLDDRRRHEPIDTDVGDGGVDVDELVSGALIHFLSATYRAVCGNLRHTVDGLPVSTERRAPYTVIRGCPSICRIRLTPVGRMAGLRCSSYVRRFRDNICIFIYFCKIDYLSVCKTVYVMKISIA